MTRATGEFMSVDPDLAETDQPYAYAGDDPVNEGDPTRGPRICSSDRWKLHYHNSGSSHHP